MIKKAFDKQLFMINCLMDIYPEYTNDKFQTIRYIKPNDNWVWFDLNIGQKSKKQYLDCSYSKVWSIFYIQFNMKYHDTQSYIQTLVLKHTKWGLVTPYPKTFSSRFAVL